VEEQNGRNMLHRGRMRGWATMAMIALKCPSITENVVDVSQPRIAAWNSVELRICEPGPHEIVKQWRDKNLFFSIDVEKNIAAADINFVSVNTPRVQLR
jgi:UDPglucose 6-dehydrogenase